MLSPALARPIHSGHFFASTAGDLTSMSSPISFVGRLPWLPAQAFFASSQVRCFALSACCLGPGSLSEEALFARRLLDLAPPCLSRTIQRVQRVPTHAHFSTPRFSVLSLTEANHTSH